MQSASRFLAHLYTVERFFCVAAFALLTVVLFLDILLRSLIGHGIAWSHELGVFANVVVSLLGIGLASARGAHLRPRFADNWLPARWQTWLPRAQQLTTALIFLLFALLSVVLIIETWRLQERSTVLQLPVWPLQLLLPAAFSIAVIRHLLFAIYPALQPAPAELAE